MARLPRIRRQDAETVVAEERSWFCASCTAMLDDADTKYCRHCGAYWEDVAKGLFDDPSVEWEDF